MEKKAEIIQEIKWAPLEPFGILQNTVLNPTCADVDKLKSLQGRKDTKSKKQATKFFGSLFVEVDENTFNR